MGVQRKVEDVLDIEHFDILLEKDQDEPGFIDEMISGFEKNGKESLEKMYEAIEAGDFEKIKFFSYKLKRISGTLGAKILISRSSEIEKLAFKGKNLDEIKRVSKNCSFYFLVSLEHIKKRALSHG